VPQIITRDGGGRQARGRGATIDRAPMTAATFWSLTMAAACLWVPRRLIRGLPKQVWLVPAALAVVCACAGRLIDETGVAILAALGAAAYAANHARNQPWRAAAHVLVIAISAGLFLHVLPGFDNPRLVDHVVLSPGASPYTQYLNVDKGMAGVLLLGIYVPGRVAGDRGAGHVAGFFWRFSVVVVAVIALSLATGYVGWDPKLPAWWPTWLGTMLVLTALPEEAAFRGVIHSWIARRLGDPKSALAILAGGVAFGVAHVAGGPMYVLVATVAGIGYGWIYSSTESIAAAILAHAGLNTIHFLLFTYPALAAAP
jgi:membrane protease YdiL (CAAX protease family)